MRLGEVSLARLSVILERRSQMEPEEGTNHWAIGNGRISAAPLSLDSTDERARERLLSASNLP